MTVLQPNQRLARTYAISGVPVFPCREAGERAKSPYVANGYHQANASPALLQQWAAMYPHALYGLPCAPNGMFVLDADRHGNGDGIANIMAFFARHGFDWQSVPVAQTPRDGLHFLFQKPAGLGKTKGRIADAVDVRDHGYIIAPGNTLPDGRRYALVNGTVEQLASAIANRTLPMMPEWLIASALQPSHAPAAFKAPANVEATANQLRGLVHAIVGAQVGNRNRVLFWASCRVGGLVSHGIIDSATAFALLLEAGRQAGLGHRETCKTALSGLHQGQRDAAREC